MVVAVNTYIDRFLAKHWEPDARGPTDGMFRSRFLRGIDELVVCLKGPFLVAGYLPIPDSPGPLPDWGPWVVATVVYQAAASLRLSKRESRPLMVAEAVIEALREKTPDKSLLHRKMAFINACSPGLLQVVTKAHLAARTMIVQNNNVLPLIHEDCFPPVMQSEVMSLLFGEDSRSANAHVRQFYFLDRRDDLLTRV